MNMLDVFKNGSAAANGVRATCNRDEGTVSFIEHPNRKLMHVLKTIGLDVTPVISETDPAVVDYLKVSVRPSTATSNEET